MMILLLVIAAAIAAFLLYANTRPDTFTISRSVEINAAPDRIFPVLNDFKEWAAWSPYERIDPAMKRNFGAVTMGKGATYAWEGNGKVGAGNMELTASVPSTLVALDLNMLKPMAAKNRVKFTLVPNGGATSVTWAMEGNSSFMGKLMGVVMNVDKMVGGQFEEGLGNLKRVCERKDTG